MKTASHIKKTIVVAILAISVPFIMVACSNSGSSPSSGGGQLNNTYGAITIDSAGVVPLYDNSSTTSVIYVHNNTNKTITGISYSGSLNNGNNSVATSSFFSKVLASVKNVFQAGAQTNFLNPGSAAMCGTIAAGQSCTLEFTIPNTATQGAGLINADYKYNDKQSSYTQVINYSRVPLNSQGVSALSGVSIPVYNTKPGYGVVYLYGGGTNNTYTISKLEVDKPGVKVTQGNILGRQLQSGYVQAVELMMPANTLSLTNKSVTRASILTNLSISSQDINSNSSFKSAVSLNSVPINNGSLLVSGLVPLVNTSTSSQGYTYIINAGDTPANLGSISYPANVSAGTGSNSCGSSLAPGAYCELYFNISSPDGSGVLSIPYDGVHTSLDINMLWYNSTKSALIGILPDNNPLTFSATVGGTTAITLTNLGGYDISNLSATNPNALTGSASGTSSTVNCTAGGTHLPIGNQCTFSITLNDNLTENGLIKFTVSGDYNDGTARTYTRDFALNYDSIQHAAILNIAAPAPMTIVGNNIESSIQVLTITNDGQTSGTISGSTLSPAIPYFTILNDGCVNQTLESGTFCNVSVKLGATTAQAITNASSVYQVTYSGGGQTSPGSLALGTIPYTIQPNTQNIELVNYAVSGTSSGTGDSTSPYILDGSYTSPQLATLTYSNGGTNPIQITGVTNTNSPIAWSLDSSSSCLPGGLPPSPVLNVGESCTIVFKNVLRNYALAAAGGVGSSYTENLEVPTIVFKDTNAIGTQFEVQATLPSPLSGINIYATGHQATVANVVTFESSNNTLTVSHSLANAIGYSPFVVTTNMEDYFESTSTMSSACTSASSSSIRTQTCTLSPDANGINNQQGVYITNSIFIGNTLNNLFSIDTNGQTASMTPISNQTLLQ